MQLPLSEQPLVILTATIRPNVARMVALADPLQRLVQYRSAISWWASRAEGRFRLGIVETSGAALEELASGLTSSQLRQIAFHSYSPSEEEVLRGKGAIELAAIGSFLDWIDGGGENSTIVKITGRLTLANCASIVVPIPPRTIFARASLDRTWLDTRVLVATRSVWNSLIIPAAADVNDENGVYLERALAARLAAAAILGQVRFERFPERPLLHGQSGSTGRPYNEHASRARARLLGRIERALVWISARKQA